MKERSRSTPKGEWAGDLGRRCHGHRLSPLPQARSHEKKKKRGQDHSAKTRFGKNGLTQKKKTPNNPESACASSSSQSQGSLSSAP